MKILSIKDGLKIKINHTEENIETIFGLDEKNSILQNFTFQTNIQICSSELNNTIDYCNLHNNIKYLENGFLFYSFRYQISFVHFMTQTLPKLYEYVNLYSHCKLLIPKHEYNELYKEILTIFNIQNYELLEDKTIYIVNDFKSSNLYDAPPNKPILPHFWVYKKIRETLNIKNNIMEPYKKIYLKRNNIPDINFGNSETGIKRQILNENELIKMLIINGFEIITLGTKTFMEKSQLLENSKIIVTPLGANCFNFIFSNAPKNILILSNDRNFGETYYKDICSELNNKHINQKTLRYSSLTNDPLNYWNSSFNVDINEVYINIKKFVI